MYRSPDSRKPAAHDAPTGLETSTSFPASDISTDSKSKASAQRALDPKWRAQRAWNDRNRHARRAHALVAQAIKKGELVRWACEECGSTVNVDAHHPIETDPEAYSKPLDGIVWLCRSDHRQRHAAMRKGGAA
ncbi:hypothetical protein [Mesorhizobium sp. M1252]|uniref:hypothetical protein n=1 Tax=Mesorhizobium sp. M1252 TaxID=2957073 RepID=UPI003338A98B